MRVRLTLSTRGVRPRLTLRARGDRLRLILSQEVTDFVLLLVKRCETSSYF